VSPNEGSLKSALSTGMASSVAVRPVSAKRFTNLNNKAK
jgi:hypothetical protein